MSLQHRKENTWAATGTRDGLPVTGQPDCRPGGLFSGLYQTAETAGEVLPISLPEGARGFRLWPYEDPIRFAVDGNPAANGENQLAAGGFAQPGQWETRILPPGSTTLRLRSAESEALCQVEIFT